MLEQKIQTNILKFLDSIPNLWCAKIVTANKGGVPDILVCYRGKFIAFEVKNEKGRATKLQLHQIAKINDAYGKACIVRSVDDVKRILEDEGQ